MAVAAAQVAPGDAIPVDAGQITTYLAEALAEKGNITVITNVIPVFESLRGHQAITLILTGGAFRAESGALSGPTAEISLRELRADKLFLTASGISSEFGLSHSNLAEVAIKQAMIRAVRGGCARRSHEVWAGVGGPGGAAASHHADHHRQRLAR